MALHLRRAGQPAAGIQPRRGPAAAALRDPADANRRGSRHLERSPPGRMPARRGGARHDRGCSPAMADLSQDPDFFAVAHRQLRAAARRAAGAGGGGCRPGSTGRPPSRCSPMTAVRTRASPTPTGPRRPASATPGRSCRAAVAPFGGSARARRAPAPPRRGRPRRLHRRLLRPAHRQGRPALLDRARGGLAARPRRRDDRSGGDLRGMARRVSDRTSSRGSATRHRRPARMARSRDPASRRSLPSRRPAGPSRPGSGLEGLPIASRHGTRRRPGPW